MTTSKSLQKEYTEMNMNITKLMEYLKYYFRHNSFKTNIQKNAIIHILKRESDVLISMPPGNGRSLCYQLPALIFNSKITIILSSNPTRINKQMNYLASLNICTEVLNDEINYQERNRIIDSIYSRATSNCLLFVTPDQVSFPYFKELMLFLVKSKRLAYVVVDETHCENQWVHGFKTAYDELGLLRKQYLDIPWIVISSIAGVDVVSFMKSVLCLQTENFKTFSISSFRSNMFYDVIYDDTIKVSHDKLTTFINHCYSEYKFNPNDNTPCGIIFCKTSEVADNIARSLSEKGILVSSFHAGLKENEQIKVLDAFMNDHINVITVTSVFGMKINKPNVRFIVHWGLPSSVPNYISETGLVGKDGLQCRSRLYVSKSSTSYYSRENEAKLELVINRAQTIEEFKIGTRNLCIFLQSSFMKLYCETIQCRHTFFCEYYGDPKPLCINRCDICLLYTSKFLEMRNKNKGLQRGGVETFIDNVCKKYENLKVNNQVTSAEYDKNLR